MILKECKRREKYCEELFAEDLSVQGANDFQDLGEDEPDIILSKVENAM